MRLLKFASIAAGVALLSGCMNMPRPAMQEHMRVEGSPSERIQPTPLRGNVAVGEVAGGQATNPLWVSKVGNSEFAGALDDSLAAVGLRAPRGSARFVLDSMLQKLDQPLLGLELTVTASVHYTVKEQATGKVIYDRTLTTPYTAAFSDALAGNKRLRMANEGAIRENISKLVSDLVAVQVQ